jgi:hypothetical protein
MHISTHSTYLKTCPSTPTKHSQKRAGEAISPYVPTPTHNLSPNSQKRIRTDEKISQMNMEQRIDHYRIVPVDGWRGQHAQVYKLGRHEDDEPLGVEELSPRFLSSSGHWLPYDENRPWRHNLSSSQEARILSMDESEQYIKPAKRESTSRLDKFKEHADQVCIKIYHNECLQAFPRQADDLLETALEQYDQLIDADLPVAKILNYETALDDRYLVCEKLPHFKPNWGNAKCPEDLELKDLYALKNLENFFRWAICNRSEIPLDLRPSNFGVTEDGSLALLDFMEHRMGQEYAFKLIALRCAEELSCGNPFIFETLKNAAINANPSCKASFFK